jgi:tricorn protease
MLVSLVAAAVLGRAQDSPNSLYLMRNPATNGQIIVFSFARDLWSVPIEGGEASRLTNSTGSEGSPIFSPDGKTIAFTGQYDGNVDVFTMSAQGGIPKRLTAHPASDVALGWTPDGKDVLFASTMNSATGAPKLMMVPVNGGYPKALQLPMGTQGSFSPDESKIAYVAGYKWEPAQKRYRGGQAYSIWIANLSDSKWKAIPKKNENNENPMWIGDKVFFRTDKTGVYGIDSYDVDSGKIDTVVKPTDWQDVKSASAGPGCIVYEKLGSVNIYDLASKQSRRVPISIHGDFPEVRQEFKNLARFASGASISPTGQRVVVDARGQMFTVPASKGDVHILTGGDGIDRRDPAWSPDGRTVAYVTDEHENQELALLDLKTNSTKYVALGEPPAYYYGPTWSPDSKKIAYTDDKWNVWIFDMASSTNTKVDTGTYTDPLRTIAPSWSPDSKWLTWNRDLDSHVEAVFLYSLDSGKVSQLTDGMANAAGPVFDREGKYLYFYASTNFGQSLSWLDLSSFNQPNVTSSVYAVVLDKSAQSPLQPESDEEPIKEEPAAPMIPQPGSKPAPDSGQKPATLPTPTAPSDQAAGPDQAKPAGPVTKIDLDGIDQRIISLPLPEHNYTTLATGAGGGLFALYQPPRTLSTEQPGPGSVVKFSFTDRTPAPYADGITGIQGSADGKKMLMFRGPRLIIQSAVAPAPGAPVDTSSLMSKVDPRKEWSRYLGLVCRNEKLLLYAPNVHGVDMDAMYQRYAPYLVNIQSRADLNYLLEDLTGEVNIGHMWVRGGDIPSAQINVPGGLLGADYAFENGRYRITRIYDGERWNPGLRSPLAQPGINAKVGEYILAIDGVELKDSDDIYETLEGKAGKQVKVKVGPNADGSGSREVTVVPVGDESGLRLRAWAEDNRRRVAAATEGKIGYVWVPDTAEGGWTEFNRYYFAQTGRKGMVVDERFNTGGLINNFMVDEMAKTADAAFSPRHGKDWPTPGAAIFGPKVMLANQFSGSGGDMFPWLFKERKIGPVIGKRTWGGLVAAFGFPLPDGGSINSPNCAFYNLNGTWDVEGHGVDPDVDVEMDPFLWRQGKDAQLEEAIAQMQKAMKSYKYPNFKRPAYPDRTKVDIRY